MQKCAVNTKLCGKLRKMTNCAIPHPPHLNVAYVRPENIETMFSRQQLTQKNHLVGQLFVCILRPQALWGPCGDYRYFPAKSSLNFNIVYYLQISAYSLNYNSGYDKYISIFHTIFWRNFRKNFLGLTQKSGSKALKKNSGKYLS